MTTHQIEIEGLPDGWKPVAYRYPNPKEKVFDGKQVFTTGTFHVNQAYLIVEKIHQRRVVLEETEESSGGICQVVMQENNLQVVIAGNNIWREVKEDK